MKTAGSGRVFSHLWLFVEVEMRHVHMCQVLQWLRCIKQNQSTAYKSANISSLLHHNPLRSLSKSTCIHVLRMREVTTLSQHMFMNSSLCTGNGVYIVLVCTHHLCIWSLSKLWQSNMTMTIGLEITSTSKGRNVRNPVNSATTTREERNIPEVICKLCLAGGRDHRQEPSEVFLIDEARPGQVSGRDCGPVCCKHSLMEASNPGTHMRGCTQTHIRALTCAHTRTHCSICEKVGKHSLFSQFTFPAAYLDEGQSCSLESPLSCLTYMWWLLYSKIRSSN